MSNPSAGLSRGSLEEVCADEPELLFSIRRIAIARRRDLGEDIKSVGAVLSTSMFVDRMIEKLKHKVRWPALLPRPLVRHSHATWISIISIPIANRFPRHSDVPPLPRWTKRQPSMRRFA